MRKCHDYTNKGFTHIANMSTLKTLKFSYYKHLGSAGIFHLSNASMLEELVVDSGNCRWPQPVSIPTIAALSHIFTLSNLKVLQIDNRCTFNDEEVFSQVSNLVCLEELSTNNCQGVNNNVLFHISNISTLRKLDVCGCPGITDIGVSYLHKLV